MAKLDPRAEADSIPPTDDFSVDRVAVPKTAKRSSIRQEPTPDREEAALESSVVAVADADKAADSSVKPKVEVAHGKITSEDPRYEPIE